MRGLPIRRKEAANLPAQPKDSVASKGALSFSSPTDASELEADAVEERVVSSTEGGADESTARSVGAAGIHESTGRTESVLGNRPRAGGSAVRSHVGGGVPLPDAERQFFERRIGADFSNVRIHADAAAAETARLLGADAFSVGGDVAFAHGQYRPGTLDRCR